MGPHDFAEASCEGPKSIQASSQAPAGATLSGQDATITTCTSCISASRGFLAYMFSSHYSFMTSFDCWHSYSLAVSTTTNCVRSVLQERSTLQDELTKVPSLVFHGCHALRFFGCYSGSICSLQASSRNIRAGESVGARKPVPELSFVTEIISKTKLIITLYDRGKDTKNTNDERETKIPKSFVGS